ncbi:pseudouridine synthase [Candidatus Dojkabacteria bacterium]|uniref:Pseudouridine synthase n=1 Tax=Candidatus Dojkabacteria bacterium TaxID=2099670 RepID=A0A5C7JBD5_9BACT|nr:MAG: pseudouridine synthase [Candidatus Dojkabacteria bacterium]
MSYTKRVLIATDRWINVAFLRGRVGETVSGRAYRQDWKIRPLIDALFFWEVNHCEESYKWDRDNRDFVQ